MKFSHIDKKETENNVGVQDSEGPKAYRRTFRLLRFAQSDIPIPRSFIPINRDSGITWKESPYLCSK